VGHGNKVPLEDFAQLEGLTRDTKYDFSMEKIIPIINRFCTFPVKEKARLFSRIIFNYLIGNEDMHLKNYSLITRNGVIELAPAYDFINTTIAIGINRVKEEIALPLNGKKNNLSKKDILDYYAVQKLGLNPGVLSKILDTFSQLMPVWRNTIESSFLSAGAKEAYNLVLDRRAKVLNI